MPAKQQLFLVIVSALLTSCLVGPNYVRPPVAVPAKFKEAKGKSFIVKNNKDWKIAEPRDSCDRGEWWKIFHDPQLNTLEVQLNLNNQSVANAVANYYQARAIVDEARASYYPTLVGIFDILRQKGGGGATTFSSASGSSVSTGEASTGIVRSNSPITTSYSAVLDANWEPDIWGLVRRTVESDSAAAQASQALLAVTRLSAQGSLAQYYFELRTLDTNQQLLDNMVKDYKKSWQLTRNQYASGIVSQADILQALSLLDTAKAQAINNGILRGQYEHAIAVLIGRSPANFSLAFSPLKATPPVIPVSIPTAWLERRPDVAEAERQMQQYSALIGVAVAAYYPSLNLSASISAAGTTLGKLLSTPSIGWSYGLQLAETIFDGGLRDATVRAAQAAYTAQVATYRQTVLSAFQDVEDNLINLRLLREQVVPLNEAVVAAKKALQLIINQYKAGTVNYASVLTAEISLFTAEQSANNVIGLQMTAAVGLIKSLGGGWSTKDISPV